MIQDTRATSSYWLSLREKNVGSEHIDIGETVHGSENHSMNLTIRDVRTIKWHVGQKQLIITLKILERRCRSATRLTSPLILLETNPPPPKWRRKLAHSYHGCKVPVENDFKQQRFLAGKLLDWTVRSLDMSSIFSAHPYALFPLSLPDEHHVPKLVVETTTTLTRKGNNPLVWIWKSWKKFHLKGGFAGKLMANRRHVTFRIFSSLSILQLRHWCRCSSSVSNPGVM